MRILRPLTCAALLLLNAACLGVQRTEPGNAAPSDLPPARQTVQVLTLPQLQAALDDAQPGDHILLADGVYTTREPIRIGASGSESAPIVVRSETIGGAEIGGASGFVLDDADHVVIHGFVFTHGSTQDIPAGSHHVRFARNTFELSDSVRHWLQVAGDDAEVDHNVFQNKTTEGVYLSVVGPEDDMAKRTWIHHNYFYNHQFAGSNGGESIRLGLSWRSLWSAFATVEHNLFELADGDPEAISNKSSDNVIRYNTIRNSEGCIVLRHGNRTTVAGNFIIDSGCGLRVYGNEHRILNNYVAGSSGKALTIGSGMVRDHEADHSPEERRGYDAAERMRIVFNTLVGNAAGIVGEDRAFPPGENVIANNIVQGDGAPVVFDGNAVVDFRWEGNLFTGTELPENLPKSGYSRMDPELVRDEAGIYRLAPGSPAIDAARGSYPEVERDMDGQMRGAASDIGADEYSSTPAVRRPLTRADVGPQAH